MVDVVSPEVRSRMMSGIKGKNTKPEVLIRSALHKAGLRFRIHGDLPGKPDLVFPRSRAVLFVHGCFWHRHKCKQFKWPKTRPDFWRNKIMANVARDRRHMKTLENLGWRTGIIWECALRGPNKKDPIEIAAKLQNWLAGKRKQIVIKG